MTFDKTKYTSTNPLPDASMETELTTFITLWKDSKDKELKQTIERCQMAEEVLKDMQTIKGEAMAMYDGSKLEWCNNFASQLRELELRKYDEVTAKVLEYMDEYLKLTPEEKKEAEAKGKKAGKAGVDVNMAPRREMNEVRPDIMFGAFVYYSGTGLTFDEIWFPKKEQNGMYSTRVPNK
jgi:Cancer susceptibility candidate 1 N-terminus